MAQTKEIYGIKTVFSRGQNKTFYTRIGVAHVQEDGTIDTEYDYIPNRPDIKIRIMDKKENGQ